jgi:5-methylcytosine-specific restriction endonuclease McrA
MKTPPIVRFQPVGKCIYCGEANGLHDEHIVPLSFGGYHIIEQASCGECGDKTGADEGLCCGGMLRALRVHHQIPTRRPKTRPIHLDIIEGDTPHGAPIRKVPVDEAPGVTIFPIYAPPNILLEIPPAEKINILGFHWWDTSGDGVERSQKLRANGFKGALAHTIFNVGPFERTLAKIAHGYFISQPGSENWRPLLQKIVTRENKNISYLVGGTTAGVPNFVADPSGRADGGIYQIVPREFKHNDGRYHYLVVQIRLFSYLRPLSPVYSVVAAESAVVA